MAFADIREQLITDTQSIYKFYTVFIDYHNLYGGKIEICRLKFETINYIIFITSDYILYICRRLLHCLNFKEFEIKHIRNKVGQRFPISI